MNTNPNIIDVDVQNFQEVIEKSQQTPVFMEFYANAAPQSQEMAVVLRKLADEYQGKFILARVDVEQNPQIAQQLQVRGLPTVKVIHQGQLAQNLEGPQEESALRELLEQMTMSPAERIQEQVKYFLEQGDRAGAIQMLQQAIEQEPGNEALKVELADLLVMESRIPEAQQILAVLSADAPGISKPKNRIAFIEKAATFPSLEELQTANANNTDDLNLMYQLAIRLVANDEIEPALETLLEMLKKDKEFEEQLARRTMVDIFELLGKGDPTATAYRRKMFTFLH